jgi:hypothetical protein
MDSRTTDFQATGALLLDLLGRENSAASLRLLLGVVETWARDYDRGEKLDASDGCNRMHVLGVALCVLLHRCPELASAEYDLRAALGPSSARVMLSEKCLSEHNIAELQNLVTALQLEFVTLYTLQESAEGDGSEAGYWSLVNIQDICVRTMAQLGALLAVERKLRAAECNDCGADEPAVESVNAPTAVVHGLMDMDAEGYCTVRTETFVSILDALHSIYCLHALLTRAQFIACGTEPANVLVQVHAHHREASNEVFFSQSITSDCVVGSIAQYAHRFAHLFHSVSQTIYYNHPTYNRQTQLSLADLQGANACSVNLLPLLTELRPDIPVLFEHTGAGCRHEHAKHPWSWVLWSHFVLLVDSDMQPYVAADARTLLGHAVV